jgi:hypothetical protein
VGLLVNPVIVVFQVGAEKVDPVVCRGHREKAGIAVGVVYLDIVEYLGNRVSADGLDTAVHRAHRGILVLPENLDGVDNLVLVVTQALMVFPAIVDIRGSVVQAVLVDIRDQVENPGGLVIVGLMEIRDIAVTLAGLVKVV